jgi:mRNA interferase RelE/StbE
MPDIVFTEPAIDDLRHLGPDVAAKVLKKILVLLENPKAGYPLGAELAGFRKLVVGRNTWRIGYRLAAGTIEICEIWAVGARADAAVYAAAVARVQQAGADRPELILLRDVVERLGQLAGSLSLGEPLAPEPEPVPDWLADRLIHTVGMPRTAVAALDLRQAVDIWAEYRSAPRP